VIFFLSLDFIAEALVTVQASREVDWLDHTQEQGKGKGKVVHIFNYY
jgi:predicted transcriptional regulator